MIRRSADHCTDFDRKNVFSHETEEIDKRSRHTKKKRSLAKYHEIHLAEDCQEPIAKFPFGIVAVLTRSARQRLESRTTW